MDHERPLFTVACCSPDCKWKERYESQYVAKLVGQQHQREHVGHKAVVFPPGEEQEIAA